MYFLYVILKYISLEIYVSSLEASKHMQTDMTPEPPHDKTNKMACAPRELRSVWATAKSDQSLCCVHEESLGS